MVETVRRILDYTGGTLVVPMTVLVESYWHEIRDGLDRYDIPVRHFVLHVEQDTLHDRIKPVERRLLIDVVRRIATGELDLTAVR